jgi:hypothetical protein
MTSQKILISKIKVKLSCITVRNYLSACGHAQAGWIPAFAGMTKAGVFDLLRIHQFYNQKNEKPFNIIVLDLYNTLMKDIKCIQFLQWALPRLRMRWPGFRKVRRQVCKRINRRIMELRLNDVESYRGYLQIHPDEWIYLDSLCRISISRFYRDKSVFDCIGDKVFPALASHWSGNLSFHWIILTWIFKLQAPK